MNELLAPISIADFLAEYWEAKHLHLGGRSPRIYSDILTTTDLDEYLSRDDLRYPSLRMVRAGKAVPLEDFAREFQFGEYRSDGAIDVDRVYEHYRQGASIVLQLMRSSIPGISAFANSLQQELGFNVEATVYATPPGEQGFTTHYDTHSVIVLQIGGRKRWRLYDWAADLPLLSQTFDTIKYEPTPVRNEITLDAGDLLYVPRGLAHDACAIGDVPSIHITIGLFPIMVRDVFERRITQLRSDQRFREAPVTYFTQDDHAFRQELQVIVRAAFRDEAWPQAIADIRNEHIARQSRLTYGRLGDLDALSRVSPSSVLRLRSELVFELRETTETVAVHYYDRKLSLPAAVAPAVRALLSGKPMLVRDLQANLSDSGKLTLARKFLSEGLAELSV